MKELSGTNDDNAVVGFSDDDIIRKALNLPGPFVELKKLKDKCSKNQRGLLLTERFERCVDMMVTMGMGKKHDATQNRRNGHPLILQVLLNCNSIFSICKSKL